MYICNREAEEKKTAALFVCIFPVAKDKFDHFREGGSPREVKTPQAAPRDLLHSLCRWMARRNC